MAQYLFLPATDHDRMNFVFLGNLAYRFDSFDCLKGNRSFELEGMLPSLFLHNSSWMFARNYEHHIITYPLVLLQGNTSPSNEWTLVSMA